jgi:hypothetical protein
MKVLRMITDWFARIFYGKKNNYENVEWKEIEYFHESWKSRIKAMAVYLTPDSTVIDFGSGKEWLREFLPMNCNYIAVDYLDRGTSNLVCDFNKGQFPEAQADYAVISGCLEYIVDYNWFVEKISNSVKTVIVSYNTLELLENVNERKQLAWKNHLSEKEIIDLFTSKGMYLDKIDRRSANINKNLIFIFKKV